MNILTIVIPCFNEEESLPELIKNIKKLSEKINFLIVENSSTDNSYAYLKKINDELPKYSDTFKKKILDMELVF